jgi:molybdopterin biosynthesis enzyme
MTPPPEQPQRIARLTPLVEALARLDALALPVAPHEIETARAALRVLAADAVVPAPVPVTAIALRDGWALRADQVGDAGPYSPVPIVPAPEWVDVGAPVHAPADSVVVADAVRTTAGVAEAIAAAMPGEFVLAAGADASPDRPLRCAGEQLRATDIAMLRAAGVPRVRVREPRLAIFTANAVVDAIDDVVSPLIADAVAKAGGVATLERAAEDKTLATMLNRAAVDGFIVIGGSGCGRHDASVRTLAQRGQVAVHGIGLVPGETAALGAVGQRPVLLLPGRLDAAVAVWLVLGTRMLARLSGLNEPAPGSRVTLARKITSTVGLAEVVLVRRTAEGLEPLASGHFPLHTLARADGWVLVPADSEGYPAGAAVDMRALS